MYLLTLIFCSISVSHQLSYSPFMIVSFIFKRARAPGSSLNDVVKVTIYLTDMNDFKVVNEIYGQYFSEPYPARAAIEVSGLAKDAIVEIQATGICEE